MNLWDLKSLPTDGLARKIFQLQAPLLLLATIALTAEYLVLRAHNPLLANAVYPDRVEYILASFCIMLGSMLLGALHEKDLQE